LYRGQIVTLDLLIALSIAMAVVLVINTQWGVLIKSADDYHARISAEKAAYLSSFFLTNGPGYPSAWNSTNVRIIGVAKDLDVIDQTKFNTLMKIDNSSLGEMLGVPEYKIFINLTDSTGTTINYTGLRPVNQNLSSSVLSFVSFNSNLCKLYVTVWK